MSTENLSYVNADTSCTSDDILGKEVIDSYGTFIGVAEKVFIDPNKLEFVGIGIDKGFLRKGLIIGRNYIRNVASHAVFLKIRPALSIKGMLVFDNEGRKVGTVRDVELQGNSNSVKHLIVASSKGTIVIPHELIESVGHNVFLRARAGELNQA